MQEEAARLAAQEDAAAQEAARMAACKLAVMLAPAVCIRKWCALNSVLFMSGQDASSDTTWFMIVYSVCSLRLGVKAKPSMQC